MGFVANLTGQNAALGVDGRDGALLAVDRINSEGGVNGRPIELIVRDDLGSPEGAIAADRQLIEDESVFAIIGHMTSGTMMAAWPEFKDSGVTYLSPTVSTPQLSGLNDNFFRLIVENVAMARGLAEYAYQDLGLRRIAIFVDTDNYSFTDTYRQGFATYFSSLGGEIVFLYEFSSATAPDFRSVLTEVQDASPDGLFMITSAADTALIAQHARLIGLTTSLLATNWALTDDLIQNGGRAVDGIITLVSHDENNQSPVYLEFASRFQDRFGRRPTFAAGYGYEAVLVMANALSQTGGEPVGLQQALLQTRDFPGVIGTISFDPFGDVRRTLYLIAVRNGEFVTENSFEMPAGQ